jgi:putative oxidoreductase
MNIEQIGTRWASRAQGLLRIMTGLFFLQHGTTKHLGFPPTEMSNVGTFSLIGIAGLFELVGGVLFILGLFTRPVAFVLSGMAATGYFLVHFPQSFFPIINGGELVALYSFVFLFFAAGGSGAWSIDNVRSRSA